MQLYQSLYKLINLYVQEMIANFNVNASQYGGEKK